MLLFYRNAFISASPDNIKQWKLPNGTFLQNLSGHKALVNALAINMDGVVVSGGRRILAYLRSNIETRYSPLGQL